LRRTVSDRDGTQYVIVNTLAAVHTDAFPLEVDRMRQYEPQQVEAARAFITNKQG